MKSELWWTDPIGSNNFIQVDISDKEIVIWQYRDGQIASLHLDRGTAKDIAAWLLGQL